MKEMGIKKVFKDNFYFGKLCFKGDYSFFALYILDVVRNDINYFLEYAVGLSFVLECVEYKRPIWQPILYLCFLFVFVSSGMVYTAWFNEKIKKVRMPVIKKKINQLLYSKAIGVDIECYDNPEYYNKYIMCINNVESQIECFLDLIRKTVSTACNVLLLGIFFGLKDYNALIFVLIIFVISTIFGKVLSKLNFEIRMKRNYPERKLEYTKKVVYLKQYAKELRLNPRIKRILFKEFREANVAIQDLEQKTAWKRFIFDLSCNYIPISFIHDFVYLLYLLYRAMVNKVLSYSNVVVLFRTSSRLKRYIQEGASIYPAAIEMALYVECLEEFVGISSRIQSGTKKIPKHLETIEFRNVGFKYPNSSEYSLRNVNISIHFPSKVAIVGFNGAGKTSLIKLLMRLYEPSEGEILLNGENIRNFDISDYRKLIIPIFQDYNIYATSLRENVALNSDTNYSDTQIMESLQYSGFPGDKCNSNLDVQLTKEFSQEGIELSGGEKQKIAIARVILHARPIIVMDEPSSSLDPISEYEFFKKTTGERGSRQYVLISHRLATTKDADQIYVLKNGEIVGTGKHQDLLSNNEYYSEIWYAQAGNYMND